MVVTSYSLSFLLIVTESILARAIKSISLLSLNCSFKLLVDLSFTVTIILYLNISLYCLSVISLIESFKPNPARINAVHPVIPKIMAITLDLYLNIFLTEILFEKFK